MMREGDGWLGRPVAALCALMALTAVSVVAILGGGNSGGKNREEGYTITLRHHGVNAAEMERSAAIPLEDALSSVLGVKAIISTSENGRARVFVRFDGKAPGRYEAVREAAQGVYETLPSSAQRPELRSSSDSRIPLWTAAVFSTADDALLGRHLERIVKPALEALEGAGEVEISGTGLPEIIVALKPEEAAARGLDASRVAAILGENDLLLPAGFIRAGDREILITLDGRYHDRRALEEALLPLEGGTFRLGDVAAVREQNRESESLSRLNGKRTAVLAVFGGADADPGRLSALIQEELAGFADLPLRFEVLSDRGAEEAAAYRSVLAAALQGAAAAALMAALLGGNAGGTGKGRRLRGALICALTVPLICLLAAAALSLLGFSLDRGLLAGLSAGAGAAVDAAILSSDGLGKARTIGEGRVLLKRLRVPLISGSVTTIAALIPLTAMESLAGGISTLAWAVGTVTFLSLVMALTALPPLLLWGLGEGPGEEGPPRSGQMPRLWRLFRLWQMLRLWQMPRLWQMLRIRRYGLRLLGLLTVLCTRRPWAPLVLWGLFSAGGIAALILTGADVGSDASENSLYAQVEFEGGLRAEETDRLLGAYGEELNKQEGIRNVQTVGRTASGSVLISFDPRRIGADRLRDLARRRGIPGGFVYIPETSATERIRTITIAGDDDRKCRELAEEAARRVASLPLVRETVLNFKDGSRRFTLIPDRERLLASDISWYELSDAVRRAVHGPVAYKRIGPEGEKDVRIRGLGSAAPSPEEIRGILLRPGNGGEPVRLGSLLREGPEGTPLPAEPAGIRRENRRRTASLSIRTRPLDPRRVRDQVMALLEKMELPPGYTLEFDREAIAAAEALSGSAWYFLLALIFCYMVIAAGNESFGVPLGVLSVVPPSLAAPALVMAAAGLPVTASTACALVAVSGMAVNASVLIAGEIRLLPEPGQPGLSPRLYRALRRSLPALLATTGTTMAASAPFLLLSGGANALIRSLSTVTVLGVGTSALCALTLLPALWSLFPGLFVAFRPEEGAAQNQNGI
ncbi:MAG: efflux RND transporter permease subunit [Spirochaetaceae bacterium]|jgi:multidrug efflux pump subunit AcrB|nr:efflux RND transporter permease subunit [Spirochaetaceae bacterium]